MGGHLIYFTVFLCKKFLTTIVCYRNIAVCRESWPPALLGSTPASNGWFVFLPIKIRFSSFCLIIFYVHSISQIFCLPEILLVNSIYIFLGLFSELFVKVITRALHHLCKLAQEDDCMLPQDFIGSHKHFKLWVWQHVIFLCCQRHDYSYFVASGQVRIVQKQVLYCERTSLNFCPYNN